jgi:DnaJ family protein A protein 2
MSAGEISIVRGQGMPTYRHHVFGDLYIQFEVVMPTMEEFEQDGRTDKILELRNILPLPRHLNPPPEDAMKEDFDLEPLDLAQQNRAQGHEMNGDDDDAPTGGERVQCASQ